MILNHSTKPMRLMITTTVMEATIGGKRLGCFTRVIEGEAAGKIAASIEEIETEKIIQLEQLIYKKLGGN